ncbi:MAG: hypothetical protein MRY57_00680 [Candidatus Pacebacteria bacterium]|nr:hypothetical protein [Candidatus Paceibacterota bacterium]
MNQLQQFTGLPYSHHAYGFEISVFNYEEFLETLPKEEFSYIVHKQYDMLKIADAREIKSLQSEKTDKASLFILEFSLVNQEAQNALLKVLEEPTQNTYFILVFPERTKLLKTLQSRLQIITIDSKHKDIETFVDVSEFIQMSLQDRFSLIKEKTDKKKDTAITKTEALQFLNQLELYASKQEIKNRKLLEAIILGRESLDKNGASIKMILDMIAMHIKKK